MTPGGPKAGLWVTGLSVRRRSGQGAARFAYQTGRAKLRCTLDCCRLASVRSGVGDRSASLISMSCTSRCWAMNRSGARGASPSPSFSSPSAPVAETSCSFAPRRGMSLSASASPQLQARLVVLDLRELAFRRYRRARDRRRQHPFAAGRSSTGSRARHPQQSIGCSRWPRPGMVSKSARSGRHHSRRSR